MSPPTVPIEPVIFTPATWSEEGGHISAHLRGNSWFPRSLRLEGITWLGARKRPDPGHSGGAEQGQILSYRIHFRHIQNHEPGPSRFKGRSACYRQTGKSFTIGTE